MPTDGPFWIFHASPTDSLWALPFQFLDRLEPNASKVHHNSVSPVRSQLSMCVVCVHKPVNYLFLCASVVYVCDVWVQVCVHKPVSCLFLCLQLSMYVMCGSEYVYTICELPFPVCISYLGVWCGSKCLCTSPWVTSAKLWFPRGHVSTDNLSA